MRRLTVALSAVLSICLLLPTAAAQKPEADGPPASEPRPRPGPAGKKAGPRQRPAKKKAAPRKHRPAPVPLTEKSVKREKDPRKKWRYLFYLTAGLTGALLIAGGITLRYSDKVGRQRDRHMLDLVRKDPSATWVYETNPCSITPDTRTSNLCTSASRYKSSAQQMFVFAAVTGATTLVLTYWAFMKPYKKKKPAAEDDTRTSGGSWTNRVAVNPQVSTKGGAVSVAVSF